MARRRGGSGADAPGDVAKLKPSEIPVLDSRFPELSRIAGDLAKRTNNTGGMRMGSVLLGFTHVETGVFYMDYAMLGGVPENQFTMIYGWEGTAKTTTAMRLVGAAQRKYPDKAAVLVDMEHTYDPVWGAAHGVDNSRLILVQPERGEEAVDVIEAVIRSPETAIVVLDSLPALVPMAVIDASAEDALVAKQAQLIGRMCSVSLSAMKAARLSHGSGPAVILVNQFRMKIGVTHGDPRVLPGGMQPKFLCTTMLETKKKKEHIGRDSRDIEIVSHTELAFHLKKSKVGASIREAEYTLINHPEHPLGSGAIDDCGAIVTLAKKCGLVGGGGTRWTLEGIEVPFGNMAAIVQHLNSCPEEKTRVARQLIAIRREQVGLSPLPHDGWLLGR